MLYDSIKIKAKPIYNEDAVNLGYIGNISEVNVEGATNFVEAINLLKDDLEASKNTDINPLITQLDFIKGETFYNIPANESIIMTYPNVDTNFFAQVQVDTFVPSGEIQSFEKWNFDTSTLSQWKVIKDPVVFDSGLIKFNNDILTCKNKYSIITSTTNGLDINKVNTIEHFLFLGSEGINVKFLISNNERVSWLNKNFEELPSAIVDNKPFANAWTANELINLSTADKLRLLEGATNTLDISILVSYTTDTPFIDYVNVDITRKGYWIPASSTKVSVKKLTTGVEVKNISDSPIDIKTVAVLGVTTVI